MLQDVLETKNWIIPSDGTYCSTNASIMLLLNEQRSSQEEEFEVWKPLYSLHQDDSANHQFWSRRSEVTSKLLTGITENFAEACLIPEDLSKCVKNLRVFLGLLIDILQTSLIYASPQKGLYAAKLDPLKIRKYILDEICLIIGSLVRCNPIELTLVGFRVIETMLEWVRE